MPKKKKKKGLRPLSHTIYTEINSKWIKELKGRPEIIKLEESTGSMLFDIILSNIFQDMPPQARETKANKQMELHQTKKAQHRE